MEDKKITIFDVARRAGVSKGTVDRVLHNRGEVSAKSAQKVRKAIEELRYEPNLYASLLAMKKNRVIACVLPECAPGEYWEKLYHGVLAGAEAVSTLNVEVVPFFYDQYDPASFVSVCRRMIDSRPSGVVLPPLFKNDTMAIAEELKANDIPYIYVDTKLEDSGYFAYYGMPMYKSGNLCAALMTERRTKEELGEILVVRIKRDKSAQSDPTINRRAGFMDFMNEYFPDNKIHTLFIDPSDPKSIMADLESFMAAHPDVRNMTMFNSRIHLLAPYLEAHPDQGRYVIGYDNLEGNIDALKQGHIHILICQHTSDQSRHAVMTLADYILMRKQPVLRDNYVHMDILTRLNVENY